MRKTFGICVAASLTLWLGGCGDDDSACISCGEPDAATTTTNEPDDAGTSTQTSSSTSTSTSSGNTTSSEPSTDGGSTGTPDSGLVGDAGSVVDVDAAVTDTDAGPLGDAGDAGQTDGGTDTSADAQAPVGTPCEQACAALAAANLECEDTSCALCDIADFFPECSAEIDAYLECIGTAPTDAFSCDDGSLYYTSEDCNEPYYAEVRECAGF